MTIKQQGGIFGRNPTFQDLSVDGSVTVPNDSISGDAIDGGHATPENITVGDTVNTEWLGVNIADPVGRLHVNDPSGTYINMKFSHTGSGTTATDGFDIIYAGNDAYFTNRESGPFHWYIGGGEKLRLETNGNANLLAGNLIVSNGKGIDFSATSGTGASELFDDYEEGTFTPTIVGTSTSGTGTYVANGQIGKYTKIGNRVCFNIYIEWTAHTGSGNMNVSGLPFSSANGSNWYGVCSARPNNISLTAGNYLTPLVLQASTTVTLQQAPTGGGSVSAVSLDTSGAIIISGQYEAA